MNSLGSQRDLSREVSSLLDPLGLMSLCTIRKGVLAKKKLTQIKNIEISRKYFCTCALLVYLKDYERLFIFVYHSKLHLKSKFSCWKNESCAKETTKHTTPAEVIFSKIKHKILETHRNIVDKVYLWSDFSTVLAWLSSKQKLSIFVANRVSIIFDTTTTNTWRYV